MSRAIADLMEAQQQDFLIRTPNYDPWLAALIPFQLADERCALS